VEDAIVPVIAMMRGPDASSVDESIIVVCSINQSINQSIKKYGMKMISNGKITTRD
jgi:hypothetical protein